MSESLASNSRHAAIVLLFLVASMPANAQFTYRPGQEYRSLNTDYYEIAIQKNGRLDVTLSSGQPVFVNAFPMVRFEGEKDPEPLKIDGRYSQRYQVQDLLGMGNGMLLRIKDCEWSIRVYPSKPYLAVQVSFLNATKKPVTVAELLPWCVGDPRKGAFLLGAGSTDSRIVTNTLGPRRSRITQGPARSDTHLAVFNPANGRSLIAGFLTEDTSRGQISLLPSEKKDEDIFGEFRASCIFDPPARVEPGERLDSEVLYLAIAERDAWAGLERYARAIAVANQIPTKRSGLPHGWVAQGDTTTESDILNELDFIASHFKRYGFSHVAIGPGWQQSPGMWVPDSERFPRGFTALTDEIHQRGLTAGLSLNSVLGTTGADRARAWGFDRFSGMDAQRLLDIAKEKPEGQSAIRAARAQLASAVKEFRPDQFLSTTSPLLFSAPFFGGVEFTHSEKSASSGKVATAAMTEAARRYYFAPDLWRPVLEALQIFDGDETLSTARLTAQLTARAMLGGAIQIADPPSKLTQEHRDMIRRVLPTLDRPARPLDYFTAENPRVWSLPIDSPVGRWLVVAVFNWSQTETETTTLPFGALKLNPNEYYTVHDFWEQRYYGTAQGQLEVMVAPGSVRVFGFRRYLARPMFLSTDSHFTQGATDLRSLAWDSENRRLEGSFQAIEGTEYALQFLVPEEFEVKKVVSSLPDPDVEIAQNVLTVGVTSPRTEVVTWRIQF